MMYGYGSGIGGWGYALMAISMVLFWGAVIYGIVALVRYARRDGPRRGEPAGPPAPEPERLLAERFARGEIDEDEYHQRLISLRAASPAPHGDVRAAEIVPSTALQISQPDVSQPAPRGASGPGVRDRRTPWRQRPVLAGQPEDLACG